MSKKPLAILTLSVLTLEYLSPAHADLADVAREPPLQMTLSMEFLG